MSRLRPRLVIIVAAVFVPLTIGTIGFILIEDFSPFEAFYMAVITVTTVGYFELRPLSTAARIFNSFSFCLGFQRSVSGCRRDDADGYRTGVQSYFSQADGQNE